MFETFRYTSSLCQRVNQTLPEANIICMFDTGIISGSQIITETHTHTHTHFFASKAVDAVLFVSDRLDVNEQAFQLSQGTIAANQG